MSADHWQRIRDLEIELKAVLGRGEEARGRIGIAEKNRCEVLRQVLACRAELAAARRVIRELEAHLEYLRAAGE